MRNATPFRLKPLSIGVFISLAATLSLSVSAATTNNETRVDVTKDINAATAAAKAAGSPAAAGIKTTNDAPQPANPADSKYSDQYVKDYFTNTGVAPGTPILMMPRKFSQSAGRFGEFRLRKGNAGNHGGIDMTPQGGLDLRAAGEGVVTKVGVGKGSGNEITIRRPNGDSYQYMHMESNVVGRLPKGADIATNQPIGVTGGTSGIKGKSYAIHLHFNYILPNSDKTRLRNFWLSNSTKQGGSRFLLEGGGFVKPSHSGQTTDPSPYLAEDLRVKPDGYTKWLGSTIRQQFNTLYNAKLPLGPGATANLRPLPALPQFQQGFEWTPENLAAARGSLVKGAEFADWSGYQGAFGSGGISYQVLSSFINSDDGEQFGSLPQPATPISIDTMTPREIIEYISTQRFGNPGWENAALKLSSKGMLTEYLMMNATENYLHQQNQRLRNRIEVLMAGVTQARLFEFNKKIEALQVAVTAEAAPSVLDLDLVDLGYAMGGHSPTVDIGNLPDELEALLQALMNTIGEGEGSYNAYNTGSDGKCAMKSYPTDKLAANTGTPMITTMTPRQIWNSATTRTNCDVYRKFTAGKYQLTYYTLGGQKNAGFGSYGFVKVHPKYKDMPFTPEVQDFAARNYFFLSGGPRPQLTDFIKGVPGATFDSAMLALSQEWASFGAPHGTKMHNTSAKTVGIHMSYYQGSLNKGNAATTDKARAILAKIGQWNKANPGKARDVLAGKAQDSGMGGNSTTPPATTPPATTPPATTPPATTPPKP